ncbi:hypothetical protein NDK43_03655 [Neobacillus pocheonensis]|uniref:Uncharacterized protein n=1 Tax=Neobacillus pocheonensis TaxID=363869 RepID=A0ABT0W6L1_9BACI|nr:hypothetical protein [Neobacillus pocheonensis]
MKRYRLTLITGLKVYVYITDLEKALEKKYIQCENTGKVFILDKVLTIDWAG